MNYLKRWKPFKELLERFFEEDELFPVSVSLSSFLATDVYETDKDVVVEMQVPGFEKNNIKVSLQDGYLRVEGKYDEVGEKTDKNYWRKEIKRGSFARTIPLPCEVKTDGAKASFKDGVLKITLPKIEPTNEVGEEIKID